MLAAMRERSFVVAIAHIKNEAVQVAVFALAIVGAWRSSPFAGFLGAASSQLWYLAFALASAARVRTLALVELVFAQLSLRGCFAKACCGAIRLAWR